MLKYMIVYALFTCVWFKHGDCLYVYDLNNQGLTENPRLKQG